MKVTIEYRETADESKPILVLENETESESVDLELLASFDNIGVQLMFNDEVHHKIVNAI